MKFAVIALIANVSAVSLSKPLIHPQTGLAITTTGQHWYGQPPLAMAQDDEAPAAAPAEAAPAAAKAAPAEAAPAEAAAPVSKTVDATKPVGDSPGAPKKGAAAPAEAEGAATADDDLNLYSTSFRGPGHLFPLNPGAPGFVVKDPVRNYDTKGYTLPEKVHILVPEVHMEFNNVGAYKLPRTAFYLQTDAEISTNQDKLEKINRFEGAKTKDVGPDLMGGYVHDFVKANTPSLPHPCRAINDKGELPAHCQAGFNEGL